MELDFETKKGLNFETLIPFLDEDFNLLRKLILEKNQVLNLTRIVSDEDFRIKNIEDSLKPLFLSDYFSFIFFSDRRKVLDIGTGGGFPLLPLAIFLSKSRLFWESLLSEGTVSSEDLCRIAPPDLYGMDSVKKKVAAVADIVSSMGLNNVKCLSERAEVLGRNTAFRETFDCAVSRAVAEIPVLLEYSVPFVKSGGLICLYKSIDISEELRISRRAEKLFGVELVEVLKYHLSHDMGGRSFLVYKKISQTSEKYPRNIGVAKKNPII